VIERTEGYLERDGEQIWYETAGDGPAVVLSHGLGGNAAVWYQQVPHFAQHHRVITWDQRGFGRSSSRTGRIGPGPAVDDLLALLDHLQVPSAALVGQSMGGWAVLGAALRAPDRVSALVLACTTGGIPPDRVAGPSGSAVRTQVGARPLGVHPALGERLARMDPARAYLYQALGTFGHRPGDGEISRMLHAVSYDVDELAALTVPVLMVCGELDALMTPALVRDAATRLAHATVLEFPGRGHSPYFEDPEPWNAAVGEFLAKHVGTGAG
jgi:pimeloyl-ACP methyl ester carboxylesterase